MAEASLSVVLEVNGEICGYWVLPLNGDKISKKYNKLRQICGISQRADGRISGQLT